MVSNTQTEDSSDPSPSNAAPMHSTASLFARIGPEPFADIAAGLYARIDRDPRIRAMFPEDLSRASESVRDMREFLTQFFGGPGDYSARKGHPRLRARHMRFAIDAAARDAWLEQALAALREAATKHGLDASQEAEIADYLVRTSQFMMNA